MAFKTGESIQFKLPLRKFEFRNDSAHDEVYQREHWLLQRHHAVYHKEAFREIYWERYVGFSQEKVP